MHSFVYAITKPITRDEHVHIDYIPTQIVTEYFRTVVKAGTQPLDGVIYPSARDRDGTNIVLFATQDNVVDSAFPAPESYAFDDPSIECGKWVAAVGAYDVVDVPPPA